MTTERHDKMVKAATQHGSAFRAAFERLDRRNGGSNFVKLADLRRALPALDRETFDACMNGLRLDGTFSLDSHEGLHGSLTPEERDAGVRENDALLVYIARRGTCRGDDAAVEAVEHGGGSDVDSVIRRLLAW